MSRADYSESEYSGALERGDGYGTVDIQICAIN